MKIFYELILIGDSPLPENMHLSQSKCSINKDHNYKGKALRYKSNSNCVLCARNRYRRDKYKKFNPSSSCHLKCDQLKRELEERRINDQYYSFD
jgi:hypothetical protein